MNKECKKRKQQTQEYIVVDNNNNTDDHDNILDEQYINDLSEIAYYKNKFRELWGCLDLPEDYFPGDAPNSIERSDFRVLRDEDYVVSLKADGTRYALMLTLDADGAGVAILINRQYDMYEVSLWGEQDFFTLGTIMDGELVRCHDGKFTYLAFDLIVVKGSAVSKSKSSTLVARLQQLAMLINFDEKEESIEEFLSNGNRIVAVDNVGDLKLMAKVFAPLSELERLWRHKDKLCYKQDGVIFSNNPGVLKDYKWKQINTIDVFVTKSSEDEIILTLGNAPNILKAKEDVLIAMGSKWKCKLVCNIVIEQLKGECKNVIECTCDIDRDNSYLLFTPILIRRDKSHANGLFTVKRTLQNISDAIQINEFFQFMIDK